MPLTCRISNKQQICVRNLHAANSASGRAEQIHLVLRKYDGYEYTSSSASHRRELLPSCPPILSKPNNLWCPIFAVSLLPLRSPLISRRRCYSQDHDYSVSVRPACAQSCSSSFFPKGHPSASIPRNIQPAPRCMKQPKPSLARQDPALPHLDLELNLSITSPAEAADILRVSKCQ